MKAFRKVLNPIVGGHVRAFNISFSPRSTLNLRRMSTDTLISPVAVDGNAAPDEPSKSLLPGIDTAPSEGQHILHDGMEYTTVKEGLAYILIPASASTAPHTAPKGESQPQSVFYNPIQQFNRDLSVLAIKAYGEQVIAKRIAAKGRKHAFDHTRKNKKRKRGEGEVAADAAKQTAGLDEHIDDAEDRSMTGKATSGTAVLADGAPVAVIETVEALEGEKAASKPLAEDSEMKDVQTTTETQHIAPDPAAPQTNGSTENKTSKAPQPPSFRILDALSATGLRAIRYAQEIPFTTSVTANDLLKTATESINLNVKHNKLTEKITSITGNALAHMYSLAVEDTTGHHKLKTGKKYDAIDLDPYGTAAPFLDAAIQSVNDGGLLCVTCTDAGVWASNGYPEKAFSLYGGTPMKGLHSHEGGLRLILHAIATSAARYGLAMEPLLSLSIDFYARVFVRIHKSALDVKFLAGKTMVVYNCDQGCGAWTMQLLARNKLSENKKGSGTFYKHIFSQGPNATENCEHCGTKTHIAGPMYAGPLHSPQFIQKILDDLPNVSKDTYQTTKRIEGMLSMALEETLLPLEDEPQSPSPAPPKKADSWDAAAVDHYPFFFIPSALSKVIHCQTPHENALRGALRHLGYRVTRSHTRAGSIKTDAPWSVIWEVMREWTRQKSPIREGAIRPGTAGWKIMRLDGKEGGVEEVDGKERMKIVFDENLGKEKDKKKLVRYQVNPRENWGPMNRAKGPR